MISKPYLVECVLNASIACLRAIKIKTRSDNNELCDTCFKILMREPDMP